MADEQHRKHPRQYPDSRAFRRTRTQPTTTQEDPNTMAIAPQRSEIGIRRHFTTPGVHPYDEVRWERRDARITNFRDGSVAFEQLGVEVPESWSVNATNILAQKYFRGTLGTDEREWSLKQVADRVADTLTAWGIKDGYFVDDEEAQVFNHELKYLIIHQRAAFNSPVWFNIGVAGVPQQGSACQPYHSLVSTPEGLVPIGQLVEDDAVGSKVLDAHGITSIVAVKHNGRKRVLRIHTKAGHQLDVTGDHLVWRASSATTGCFVPAADLRPGDQLSWHRMDGDSPGHGVSTDTDVAEAALAGWLQSDGFVGQYEGTNRSLTIEAMTVTPAELDWVLSALDSVFPGVHRHERTVETVDTSLDCRRTRLYGNGLSDFVERWGLRTRGVDMTVPPALFTAPLPVVTAYLRSLFQAEGYVVDQGDGRGRRVRHDLGGNRPWRPGAAGPIRHLLAGPLQGRSTCRTGRVAGHSPSGTLGDRIAFANEIGFIDQKKQEKLLKSLEMDGNVARPEKRLEIERIEDIGEMDVYDIQTESGEYLSANLRVHNCFILSVEDQMDSILNWYTEEGDHLQGRLGRRGQPVAHPLVPRAAQGRRHRLGPGQLHAGSRRLGRDDQVGRQDAAGRQDGHPRRRPPRRGGLHLVQGHRGAQGPRAARRRLRHGPRRGRQPLDPVPERQQLGAGDRRVHAGRHRRRPVGAAGAHRRLGDPHASRPVTSSARSPTRPGSAPTPACSTTRRSTAGTPRRTRGGSTEVTRAPNMFTSTTRPAIWPP